MFSFFWKHKLLSLFIVLAIVYVFVDPPHKFGIVTKNFVVYNRIPVSFLDAFVNFDGSLRPLVSLFGTDDQKDWMASLHDQGRGDDLLLIVGTGFGRASYRLSDSLIVRLGEWNIRTSQVPSPEAVRQYNSAVSGNKRVAILLSVRR